MIRGPALALVALWLAALVGAALAGLLGGWPLAAHAYVAAWLVAIALPLGALPILMALDLVGADETSSVVALRLILATLPVLVLLLVPVLFDLKGVYPWPQGSPLASDTLAPPMGFGRMWFSPLFFRLRGVVYGIVWVALSLFFIRPAPRSRRQRVVAGAGLAIHLVIGTLAAIDWFMSLDQGFVSSAYGLLIITAQCAFALTLALLLGLVADRDAKLERTAAMALLVVVCAAAYLQFSQYLVVWSANLPKEIVWYQTRWVGAFGPVFVVGAPLLLVVALVAVASSLATGRRGLCMAGLGLLLFVEILDLACLASPRGTFSVAGLALDLVFLVVVGGLACACAAMVGERRPLVVRHG